MVDATIPSIRSGLWRGAQILAWRPLGAGKIKRIKAPQISCQSREDREPRNTRSTRKALSFPRIPSIPRFLKEFLGEDLRGFRSCRSRP